MVKIFEIKLKVLLMSKLFISQLKNDKNLYSQYFFISILKC